MRTLIGSREIMINQSVTPFEWFVIYQGEINV